MNYGKKHDLPFGIMDVAGLLRLNIRRRAPGQVYVDCPICGDRRGKMNLNTEKDLWRCNYCGEGGGMLSLYAKVYGVSNSDAYREICDALAVNGFSPDYTVPEKTAPTEAEQSDAASVQEVHQTLSMLLSMLTLIPAHRKHLRSVRGLSDDEITRFGFKSTPPPFLCRSLTNRLVKAGCRVQGVPGFYVDDNGCWTVKFHQRTSGIIIPIFGVDGLIHGAQIRLDHPLKDKDDPPEKTGVKYLTLSSTGKRMGTTSGSPIHFVGDPCSRVVYVTEGCLKADVAHALMHRTFVATLGANNTAKLDELFAFLHRNGTEEIIEAEDMDKYSYAIVDGQVYYRENSRMVRPDLNTTAEARVKGLVGLRDCVQELIDLQMDAAVPDSTIIVLSVLSLTYRDFAFNSKTLPIFSQQSRIEHLPMGV